MPSKTVNFSVGEDAGWLVTTIAREKLMCEYDPIKAIKTLTTSFIGMQEDFALKVLAGNVVLTIDVEKQEVIPLNYIPEFATIYPKADLDAWYNRKRRMLIMSGKELKESIDTVISFVTASSRYTKFNISLDLQQIMDFIEGDPSGILDEVRNLDKVQRLSDIIRVSKAYIDESLRVANALDYVTRSKILRKDINIVPGTEHLDIIASVSMSLSVLMRSATLRTEDSTPDIDDYLQAQRDIDSIIDSGIKPVDIMDNYNAGWLSPGGEFYGLNGSISNMLHLQIANALKKSGLLTDMNSSDNTPDSYLDRSGWVRVHGDNIQFAGNLNARTGRANKYITKKQMRLIKNYINLHHRGAMKLGWTRTLVSAAGFEMMYLNDKRALHEYFEY
jgi:hypothetical protein